jgi:hypothetical protein
MSRRGRRRRWRWGLTCRAPAAPSTTSATSSLRMRPSQRVAYSTGAERLPHACAALAVNDAVSPAHTHDNVRSNEDSMLRKLHDTW